MVVMKALDKARHLVYLHRWLRKGVVHMIAFGPGRTFAYQRMIGLPQLLCEAKSPSPRILRDTGEASRVGFKVPKVKDSKG